MQSYERTHDDEDDFERVSLLHQHRAEDGGAVGGAPSFRSRRGRPRQRPAARGEEGGPSPTKNDDDDDDDERGVDDDYHDRWRRRPTRPAMTKINSIARLGRAAPNPSTSSIDGDFDDDVDCGPSSSATPPPPNEGGWGGGGGGDDGGSEYYFDDANDHSWTCSYGTGEDDGVWLDMDDPPGTFMALAVWVLIGYSGATVALLAEAHRVSRPLAIFHSTVCAMALACHARTMLSDPGAVPRCAVPLPNAAGGGAGGCEHRMCGACGGYKPPGSHHCRICGRCVSRMDHHCPWMNNCVGAGNLKSFVLFLCYAWVGCALSLMIFACNYFFCTDEKCEFEGVLVNLVRMMTIICVMGILFVSSMLANVTFGVMTGACRAVPCVLACRTSFVVPPPPPLSP